MGVAAPTHPLLDAIVACPIDGDALQAKAAGYGCPRCRRLYAAHDGVIHFVTDSDQRPSDSIGLAQSASVHDPKLYERNAAKARREYLSNSFTREMLNAAASSGSVVVDIATGPGGGYVAPLLELVNDHVLIAGTDACLPVVEQQAKLLRRPNFLMLDVDLEQRLPFRDGTVSAFTGAATNNIHDLLSTLREVHRCLATGGMVFLGERFYAHGSCTASCLAQYGNLCASMETFTAQIEDIGFCLGAHLDIVRHTGKSDPRDGLPLSEDDQWTWTELELRKSRPQRN
jgi:hypothetical protein